MLTIWFSILRHSQSKKQTRPDSAQIASEGHDIWYFPIKRPKNSWTFMSLLAFPTMFKPREMHFFPKVTLHLIWSFVARQKTPSRGDVKHMNKMLTHDLLGHHFCQCPFHGCSTIKTTTPPMIPCYASAGAHKNTFNWVTPSSNWFKSSNWFHCHNRFRVWYFETDLHNSLLV